MSKLLDSGGYGCIYYPGIDCNGKVITEPMVSKIVDNYSAQRELFIAKQVKKIKNYKDHFLPVENHCSVHGELPIKKCKAIKRFSKFKILYIPYKHKKEIDVPFNTLYHTLLKSLQLLVQQKIVHFDIKRENIIVADKIYIIDFGISIYMPYVYKHLFHVFYKYIIDYYMWPIEVHILCYMLYKGPLTKPAIRTVCTDFVKFNIVIQHLSKDFQNEYIEQSTKHYSKLLGLSSKEIIHQCIQYWSTWDHYGIMIYLFEEGFQKDITPFFLKAIHYNPTERPTIEKCLAATA